METYIMAAPGVPEILIIVFGVLLLFGGKKIPEFARGLGKGLKEFKKASKEVTDSIEDTDNSADSNQE